MTTTATIPAYLQAAINKILVLASTANCCGENAEDVYRALNRIHQECYVAMMTHDEILYPTPDFDAVEEVAPF